MRETPTLQKPTAAFLDTTEAASYLGLSRRTLEGWRVTGEGPPFAKLTRKAVRYRREDLDRWAESRLRTSTSDRGMAS